MTTIEKKAIQAKIFLGVCLTHDLRISLNKSMLWKQAHIDGILKEIRFNGKEYLGYYLQEELVQLDYLKQAETDIHNQLRGFCPDWNSEKNPIQIFSQIFIH